MKKQRIEREEALHGAQVSVEYVFTSRNADNAEHETTLQRTCPTFQCLWCHLGTLVRFSVSRSKCHIVSNVMRQSAVVFLR